MQKGLFLSGEQVGCFEKEATKEDTNGFMPCQEILFVAKSYVLDLLFKGKSSPTHQLRVSGLGFFLPLDLQVA